MFKLVGSPHRVWVVKDPTAVSFSLLFFSVPLAPSISPFSCSFSPVCLQREAQHTVTHRIIKGRVSHDRPPLQWTRRPFMKGNSQGSVRRDPAVNASCATYLFSLARRELEQGVGDVGEVWWRHGHQPASGYSSGGSRELQRQQCALAGACRSCDL